MTVIKQIITEPVIKLNRDEVTTIIEALETHALNIELYGELLGKFTAHQASNINAITEKMEEYWKEL